MNALPKFSRLLVFGKYIKVINPELNHNAGQNCIVIGEKSVVIPTRRIKELDEFEMKPRNDCSNLEMVGQLEPHQVR